MFQTDIDYTCIGRPRMDGQSVNKSAENEKTILRVVVELHEKTVYIMTLVSDVLVNHAVVNRHCWTLTPPPLLTCPSLRGLSTPTGSLVT